jgi:hypothetical protein
MGSNFHELCRRIQRDGLLRVILDAFKTILILCSIGVVIWQTCEVIQTYESQPITTDIQVLPQNNATSIRMSICKRFELTKCMFSKSRQSCSAHSYPAVRSNESYYDEFWNYAVSSKYALANIINQLQFWNDSGHRWETLFNSSHTTSKEEMASFSHKMYPFTGNHTLLCYTLNQDIRDLGRMIKFHKKGKAVGIILK